jgi:hypothetical protein
MVRFFDGSCVYLEFELLILGSEYTTDFYSLSDNEIDTRRFREEIDSQRLDCRSIFSTITISFTASKNQTESFKGYVTDANFVQF